MELVLIRHGLPLRVETVNGTPADPQLSDQGHAQAKAMSVWLASEKIDAVYSSPMKRAAETAIPLAAALSLPILDEPRVAEFDQASDRYIPVEDLKSEDRAAWIKLMSGDFPVDVAPFRDRVVEGINDIASRHGGQRVAVVCHGGVINAWGSHVLDHRELFFINVNYTSINRFLVSSGGTKSILSLNETPHFRDL